MDNEIQEINGKIDEKYHQYKSLFTQLTDITNDLKVLEDERILLLKNDGRRFLFKKTPIELRDFISYVKKEKWMSLEYEDFEKGIRPDIVDEAMIVSVYCFQPNYSSPVKIIIVFDGYLSKDEFDVFKQKYGIKLEYYREENNNAKE